MKGAKALVPIVLGFLYTIAAQFGLDLPEDFKVGLISVVTALVVWFVPNKG